MSGFNSSLHLAQRTFERYVDEHAFLSIFGRGGGLIFVSNMAFHIMLRSRKTSCQEAEMFLNVEWLLGGPTRHLLQSEMLIGITSFCCSILIFAKIVPTMP
jgi:hypothetical protein